MNMLYIVRLMTLVLAFVFVLDIQAQTPQEAYIEKYAQLAVEEMYRSGVPASITLAQGILESGSGRSSLAENANNHFGIKCHNGWNGERVYHDDDAKGECFRKYVVVEDSYRDHSDFLRYRDRYKFLFDLKPTDYKGWAYGLKKAGYATDPGYADKLIQLIEKYHLDMYDKPDPKQMSKQKKERPRSPNAIEQSSKVQQVSKKYFHFSLSRQLYSMNGTSFVYSVEGETYESIADAYNLFVAELLRFNDLKEDQPILPGSIVYLQPKKNFAAEGLDMHILDEGETVWQISQRYGVKLSKIYKLNDWDKDYIPREGEGVKLRK